MTISSVMITALPQGFGARISGFDVARGREPADVARLKQAFDEHHLLIFEGGTAVSPERQMEITGWLGPLILEGNGWTVLDNADPAGRLELAFHSDISYLDHPLAGISLCAEQIPAGGTSTSFVSNAVAWEALPGAMQDELRGRSARHSYGSGGGMGFDWPAFAHWHPVCRTHAASGRPMLYVTEHHVDRIEGMDDARSAEVLEQLFATLYAPQRRYVHAWRPGDLLVWDNLAIQHARTEMADPALGRRVMRRAQMGTMSFQAQLERERHRQAAPAGRS